MLGPVNHLSFSSGLWFSYTALTTYLAFIRKKGPVLKRLVVNALHGLGDINHALCEFVRRFVEDWRNVRALIARRIVGRTPGNANS